MKNYGIVDLHAIELFCVNQGERLRLRLDHLMKGDLAHFATLWFTPEQWVPEMFLDKKSDAMWFLKHKSLPVSFVLYYTTVS